MQIKELGDETRLGWINAENDAGWTIYHGLSQNSGVSLKTLCEWWLAEDSAIRWNHFIMKCFPGNERSLLPSFMPSTTAARLLLTPPPPPPPLPPEGAELLERQYGGHFRYTLPIGDRKLGDVFGLIEKFKSDLNVQEYSVSQTSLVRIIIFRSQA